jgi:hypothetical protein
MFADIVRYEKADYPGDPIYEAWNVGEIIHNSESDFLQVKINASNMNLYSTLNMSPSENYMICINSLREFMSNGLVVIEGNKLLSYTYLSEEDKNNSNKMKITSTTTTNLTN